MKSSIYISLWCTTAVLHSVTAVTCPTLKPAYPAPVVSSGWSATLIAQDVTGARGIVFDKKNNLLVVEQDTGVVHLEFDDGGGSCLELKKKTTLISSSDLNHGLALSEDGKTLYASDASNVYSWSYDDAAPSVGKASRTIIEGMDSSGHTSRTLLMSSRQPGTLVVSRGSSSNFDLKAQDISSGISQIRAFDVKTLPDTPFDYASQGRLLGWGLRNSVGIAEEPLTGGIYSVENSADEIRRNGVDIHENNPGEELNFHGYLNASTNGQGGNYGYPDCLALWNTTIPELESLTIGSQFSGNQNSSVDDNFCTTQRIPPRLTFLAHQAPLDIVFLPNGTQAFISFHGSWDRSKPAGYKVSTIDFADGSPVAAPDSTTSTTDIMINPDNSQCPKNCFRPVGLALDSKERLFMSSDSTGEIYVLVKSGTSTGITPSTTSGTAASPTESRPSQGQAGYRASTTLLLFAVISGILMLL